MHPHKILHDYAVQAAKALRIDPKTIAVTVLPPADSDDQAQSIQLDWEWRDGTEDIYIFQRHVDDEKWTPHDFKVECFFAMSIPSIPWCKNIGALRALYEMGPDSTFLDQMADWMLDGINDLLKKDPSPQMVVQLLGECALRKAFLMTVLGRVDRAYLELRKKLAPEDPSDGR